MTTETMRVHPELAELRAQYEAIAQTPVARAMAGFTFMTGLYLAISPWVIGFNQFTSLTANNVIVGIALAVLALGLASVYSRIHGIAWVAPLIGAWTIIAPWIVHGEVATTATIWSNVVAGVVAVLLGLGAMSLETSRTR